MDVLGFNMTKSYILRRGLVDWPLVVHCDYIPRIQEVQASIYHIIREMLGVTRCGYA
jgi:D-sedoheptulose 7-phosphate isomerase